MTNQPLSGKSALVTGGARRIGRGIALALAAAGADVAITFRSSHPKADETVRDIENLGRRSLAVECDVRSEASVGTAVAAVISRFGRLDRVVNNAGVFESAPLESLSLDQWNVAFETNARGPFLVAREALPHLHAVEGRIINIGSLGGFMPGPAMLTIAPPRPRCTRLHKPWPRHLRRRSVSTASRRVGLNWTKRITDAEVGNQPTLPLKRPCSVTDAWMM